MRREAVILHALLLFAILTLWVEERWAWSAFQTGIFGLTAWRLVRPLRLPRCAALVPLGVAALWPWLQIAFGTTVSRAETNAAGWNWFTWFLVCSLAIDLGANPNERSRLLASLAISGSTVAVLATIQHASSAGKIFWLFPSGYPDGVLGPFVNRNQYSAWVELLIPISLYLASGRSRHRSLYVCAAAVLYGSVVAGASRAGFLLATLESAAALAIIAGRKRLPLMNLLQFVGLAAMAVLIVGWHGLQARFEDPVSEVVRVDALRASLSIISDKPWTGTGLGSWPQVYPRYASIDTGAFVNQAHNDWAQWAAEGGLPFVACLLIFVPLCLKPAIRSIYGIGVLAFLLHALVDYPMQQRPGIAAWFFAVSGLVLARKSATARNLDGSLRGVGTAPDCLTRRDPAGLQARGSPASSRSLC